MLNIKVTAATAENPEDVIQMNMPAFIRCLEVAREQVKDDNSLHLFVEALHSKSSETPLTADDVIAAESEAGLSEEESSEEEPA